MNISIFLFHRVSPQRDPLWDPLSPERFDVILNYLKKKFDIYAAEQVLSNAPQGKKPAAIVFDDGYKDYMDYALPLLKKHNLPSSMYVVTNCIETGLPPWTYLLDNAFAQTTKNKIAIDTSLLPVGLQKTEWTGKQEKMAFAKALKPFLKQVSDTTRKTLFDQLIQSLDDVESPQNLMMNWKDINEAKAAGTIIGSHTHTHPLLAKIEDEKQIEEELTVSAKKIKENTGEFPLTISYPIGSFDKRVKILSKKAGYTYGLAVEQKQYNTSQHDVFEVPRIELYNEPILKTKLRINGTLEKIKNLLR